MYQADSEGTSTLSNRLTPSTRGCASSSSKRARALTPSSPSRPSSRTEPFPARHLELWAWAPPGPDSSVGAALARPHGCPPLVWPMRTSGT